MADTLPAAAPYPKELERSVRLADGAIVRLRPIRPDDAPRLVALYDRLSQLTAHPSRPGERMLIEALVSAAASGLHVHLRSAERRLPAAHRLAFREIGLAIGLAAIDRMAELQEPRVAGAGAREFGARFGFLRGELEAFWLSPESQRARSWCDHVDINEVIVRPVAADM